MTCPVQDGCDNRKVCGDGGGCRYKPFMNHLTPGAEWVEAHPGALNWLDEARDLNISANVQCVLKDGCCEGGQCAALQECYYATRTKAEEVASQAAKAANLATDSDERKQQPIATGVLDYFPLALADIARLSKIGNDKHNPGQPLHWSRGKSDDHADCIMRHMLDRGTMDTDGVLHDTKVAWRALAQLQLALEKQRKIEAL